MKIKMSRFIATILITAAVIVPMIFSRNLVHAQYQGVSAQLIRQYKLSTMEMKQELVTSIDGRSTTFRPVTRAVIYILGLRADGRFEMSKMSSSSESGTTRKGEEFLGGGRYQVSGASIILVWSNNERQAGQLRGGEREIVFGDKVFQQFASSGAPLPGATQSEAGEGSDKIAYIRSKLAGRWNFVDRDRPYAWVLDEDGYVTVINESKIIDGRGTKRGSSVDSKYDLSFQANLAQLDHCLYFSGETKPQSCTRGIIMFLASDQMLWATYDDWRAGKSRPTSFEKASGVVIHRLKKVVE